jgi:hypothetical protein
MSEQAGGARSTTPDWEAPPRVASTLGSSLLYPTTTQPPASTEESEPARKKRSSNSEVRMKDTEYLKDPKGYKGEDRGLIQQRLWRRDYRAKVKQHMLDELNASNSQPR